MTSDSRTFAPPHELAGPFGQVIDVGGGIVPGLLPTPLPGAMATASPGLAAGAVAPAGTPLLGPEEPNKLALAIERLANELFSDPFGASLAPVPLAPATAMTASNVQAPGSPGLAAVAPAHEPSQLASVIERLAQDVFAGRGAAASPPAGRPGHASLPGGPGILPELAPWSGGTGAGVPAAPVGPAPHAGGSPGLPGAASAASPFAVIPLFDAPRLVSPGASAPGGAPTAGSAHGFLGAPVAPNGASSTASSAGAPPGVASGLGAPSSAGAPGFASGVGSPSATNGFGAPGFASVPGAPGGLAAPAALPGFASPGFAPGGFGVPGFSALGAEIPTNIAPESPAAFGPAVSTIGSPASTNVPGPTSERGSRVEAPGPQARPSLIRDLGGGAFDPYAVRRDFPILEERVHGGKRLVWLDNAATTQKPRAVIDRLTQFYEHENSNIHRAAHTLAARATDAYESGREATRKFINAPSAGEVIFVRGATEGINLVAQSWGRRNVAAGDEIVVTHLEHHANIVPWQQLCAATGARLRVAPVDDRGDIILEAYEKLLGPRTRLVALPQVSNALGTVTPAREMIEIAHRHGAVVLLDGAQAVSHMRVDVQALDCDFYVLSGHKVFAPTGIGAVFGKRALLEAMPPWQGGGNMIQDVTFERTTYHPPPFRFEAGTGNIADVAGLGAALDYVMRIGMDTIDRYEHELLRYAEHQLATVPGLTMIGNPRHKAGVLSFVLDGQRTEDVGGALDKDGIAVRSGHHCAQPILRRFGVEATVRASLAFYNICEDIDALVDTLRRLQAGRR